jgi:hypothetical protein
MDVHGTDSVGMLRLRLRIDLHDAHSAGQGTKGGMPLQYGPRATRSAPARRRKRCSTTSKPGLVRIWTSRWSA